MIQLSSKSKIITRFAPSPTGELHIGGARTALFSYLFAKHHGGEFLLRIEDTDRSRLVEGATERIIESLKWLGIVPDNLDNIIYQSKRLEIYQKIAQQLIKQGDAYICTCSEEQLKQDREEQIKIGQPPRYSGRCRDNNQDTRNKIQTNSKFQIPNNAVVRMKMPKEGKIIVNDLIRGKVEFDAGLIDDQIILKSDGFPTYHLASVVDDHEMEITHVIRAEEWLPSTPKHLILYQMLKIKPPKFAHLSMILGDDKSKLSKRHGATSVLDYKKQGYLPEALINFIAFLGWNPKTTEEEFALENLITKFTLEGVNKAAAVFDVGKLKNINQAYIKSQISNIKNKDQSSKLLMDFGVIDLKEGEIELIGRGGYKTMKEAADYIIKLRKTPEYEADLLIFKKSTKENTVKGLKAVSCQLLAVRVWQEKRLQEVLESVVAAGHLQNGDVFWPARVALSGEEKSPSPVELLVALGRQESIKRIAAAVKKLTNLPSPLTKVQI